MYTNLHIALGSCIFMILSYFSSTSISDRAYTIHIKNIQDDLYMRKVGYWVKIKDARIDHEPSFCKKHRHQDFKFCKEKSYDYPTYIIDSMDHLPQFPNTIIELQDYVGSSGNVNNSKKYKYIIYKNIVSNNRITYVYKSPDMIHHDTQNKHTKIMEDRSIQLLESILYILKYNSKNK
jgi:hypothetical protein